MIDYVLAAFILIPLALIAVVDRAIVLVSMYQFRKGPRL